MRIFKAAFLFVIIACFGCNEPSQYWYNEDNTIRQADKDCRECYYQAQAEAIEASMQQSRDYGMSFSVSRNYMDTQFKKCMKDKGYIEIWDDNLDPDGRKRTVEYGADHSDAGESGFGNIGHLYQIAGN